MSLDVYLTVEEPVRKSGTGVFVRRDGKTVELTAKEVAEQFEGAAVPTQQYESTEVFEFNITHNLGQMADAAGVYQALWRPEEQGYEIAAHLIRPLTSGLRRLKASPAKYKKFNPDNGWGNYDGLVRFVEEYLAACKEYPGAEIGVSR